MLIGLSGFMGAGKDAAGTILANKFGFRRLAFADALKDEVQIALHSQIIPEGLPPIGREAFLACLALGYPIEELEPYNPINPYDKPTRPEVRVLLQQWGTEFRRRQDDNYWVKKVRNVWYTLGKPNSYISDVRFLNEQTWVHLEGGYSFLIDHGKEPPLTLHESEQLPSQRHLFDRIIDNSIYDPSLMRLNHAITQAYYDLCERRAA